MLKLKRVLGFTIVEVVVAVCVVGIIGAVGYVWWHENIVSSDDKSNEAIVQKPSPTIQSADDRAQLDAQSYVQSNVRVIDVAHNQFTHEDVAIASDRTNSDDHTCGSMDFAKHCFFFLEPSEASLSEDMKSHSTKLIVNSVLLPGGNLQLDKPIYFFDKDNLRFTTEPEESLVQSTINLNIRNGRLTSLSER